MGHIENQDIQWNGCHRWWQPRSRTWTSSRPSPRCPSQGSPSTPSSSGSGFGFCCETLHWPITEKRHTQNSPKVCRQVSWDARPPCPTPPGSSRRFSPASSCLPLTWVTSPHTIRLYLKSSDTIIFYCICYRNVHLLHQGPHGPVVVPGDEPLLAGRQPGRSKCGSCASCALFLFPLKYQRILQKWKIRWTLFYNVLNSALLDVFKVHNFSHCTPPARSLETMTGIVASCWFIFAGMCLYVFVSSSTKSWDSLIIK